MRQSRRHIIWSFILAPAVLVAIYLVAILIQNSDRNFTKGVLALNTDKSVYAPGEAVLLQMASLDPQGNTLCDSNLKIEISEPGKWKKTVLGGDRIQKLPTCSPDNNVTNEPDYLARFTPSRDGTYYLKLVNTDTGKRVLSSIKVTSEAQPLTITRSGATRINPSKSDRYPMTLTVTAAQDFKGTLVEKVPLDFKFTWYGPARISQDKKNQILTWEVDLKAGETKRFVYEYDAPEVSPDFIRLQKAQLLSIDGKTNSSESRSWQIASDAISIRGENTNSDAGGTFTVSRPSTATGDFIVVIVAVDDDPFITPPADGQWTTADQSGNTTGNDRQIAIFYNYVEDGATEPASYDFTSGASDLTAWWVGSLSGVDPLNPQDEPMSGNSVLVSNSASPAAPSITTVTAGAFVLAGWATNNDTSTTLPGTPWAARADDVPSGSVTLNVVSQTFASAGPTGDVNYTGGTATAETQTGQWAFRPTVPDSFTGIAYTNDGVTADTTASICAVVNNGTPACDSTDGLGVFLIDTLASNSGDQITFFYDGGSEFGNTVTVADGGNIVAGDNLKVFQNTVIVRHESGSNIAISQMELYDSGSNDTDMLFDAVDSTSDTLTIEANNKLYIQTGFTFAPAGDVTTPKLHVVGTFTGAASKTLTLNGTGTGTSRPLYVNGGTYNTQELTLYSGAGTTDIETTTYTNLQFSPTITGATTYAFLGAPTINGNLSISPNAASSQTLTINLAANLTIATNLTISASGAALSVLDLRPISTDYNLTAGKLSIGAGGTLDASSTSTTVILLTSTSSTLFSLNGNFTAGGSTVVISPDASLTLTSGSFTGGNAFNNLSLTPVISTAGRTYTFGSGAIEVAGDFLIQPSGTQLLTVAMAGNITVASGKTTTITRSSTATSSLVTGASNPALSTGNLSIATGGTLDGTSSSSVISVTANGTPFTRTGTYTPGSTTMTYAPASTTGVTVTSGSYYNIVFNKASNTFSLTTSGITVTNDLTITAGVLDAVNGSNYPITVGRHWTNTPGTTGFEARGGTVTFDTTTTANITGSTTFYNFTAATAGKTIKFADTPAVFTINGLFTLTGAAGPSYVTLDSQSGGTTQWLISHQGTESIAYASVKNSGCSSSTDIDATAVTNYDAGNNDACWLFPVLANNSFSHWKFDEGVGTTTSDTTANNNTGTLAGTTTPSWQAEDMCVNGKCLYFEGTTAKITLANDNDIKTVSMWIRPTTVASIALADFGNSVRITTDASGVLSATGFTSPTFYIDGVARTSPTLIANRWQHVVVTTATEETGTTMVLGNYSTSFFKGFMDEVKFSNTEYTAAMVKGDFTARGSTDPVSAQFGDGSLGQQLSDGLVSYWRMDETAGDTCSGKDSCDSSGNDNHGTWINQTTSATGKFGTGTTFDGTGDYISFASAASATNVQRVDNILGTAGTTATVTISAATAGNLIVTALAVDKNSGAITIPGDFIRIGTDFTGNSVSQAVAYKIATGGETALEWNWTTSGTATLWAAEYSGLTATPLDRVQSDNSGDTSVLTQSTGATDTTTQANELAIALMSSDTWSNTELGRSWSNSFTEVSFSTLSSSSRPAISVAERNLTATGAYETTFTTTDSGDQMVAKIATFKVISGATLPHSDTFTLSAWVNPSSSIASKAIMVKNAEVRLVTDGDGKPVCQIHNGTDWQTAATGASALSLSSWQHVACSYDQKLLRVFVNGVQTGETAMTSAINTTTNNWRIGSDEAAAYGDYNGKMDEVRIYYRGLGLKEVNTLYEWAPGPKLYYNFDENTGTSTLIDRSNNGKTGTLNSITASSWAQGKYGSGLLLDGSADYVSRADDPDFDYAPTQDFTVQTWFRHDGAIVANADMLVTKADGTNGGWKLKVDDPDPTANVCFEADDDGTWTPDDQVCSTGVSYDDGLWHHAAVVVTGTTGVKLYVDGSLAATYGALNANTGLDNDGQLEVGRDSELSDAYWVGALDEVRIYQYARTAKQIVQDMNATHPAPGSPVGSAVAYWKFDDMQGTTAQDSSINNHDLTLNAAAWTPNGKFHGAWNGTGGNFRLSRATDPDLEFGITDDFAISTWFRSDSTNNPGATEYLVANGGPSGAAGYAFYGTATTGTVCFGIDDDTSWGPDIASCSTADLYDGNWHHLVGVRDYSATDKTYLYVDGVMVANTADTTTTTLDANTTFYVGDKDATDNGDEFTGDIDELKVYRFALSSDEVRVEFNRGKSASLGAGSTSPTASISQDSARRSYCPPGNIEGNCADGSDPSPIHEWKLDDNTGTTAVNTASSQNGTLQLGADWAPGLFGSAARFLGGDEKINIAGGPGTPAQVSVSMWVYLDTTTATTTFYSNDNGASTALGYDATTDKFYFVIATTNNAYTQHNSVNTFAPGRWYHLEWTYNGSSFAVYINGVREIVAAKTGSITYTGNTGYYTLGAYCSSSCSGWLKGLIDEVRVYNYGRTAAQVAWDFNQSNPVAWYKLDECEGEVINDASPHANAGNLVLGASPAAGTCTTTGAWANGADGSLNASLDFDGTDDYVTVSDPTVNSLDYSDQDFTITGWFNRDTFTTDDVIIAKRNGIAATDVGYLAYIDDATDKLVFEVSDATSNDTFSLTSTSTFTATGWNHFAIVWDDDSTANTEMYINGKPDLAAESGTFANVNDLSNAVPLRLGDVSDGTSTMTTHFFDGKLDDIRVYYYALSKEQRDSVYNGAAASL